MTFRPWTPEEDDAIVRLYGEGKRVGAISENLDRHVKSTSMRMVALRKSGRLPELKNKPPERVSMTTPGIALSNDDRLVSACLAQGGFPRAYVHDGATYWIDHKLAPWSHKAPEHVSGPLSRALKAIPALSSIATDLERAA